MPSLVPGYEYDIFISYRQKDNKYDGWVTDFVSNLKRELQATFKEEISIYFDQNPIDGILESHQVDQSIFLKIKSLIFIPILSQTYCDTNCFAWKNEFQPFVRMASVDRFGRNLKLRDGNFSSRILCVRIHALEAEDIILLESELKDSLRPIDFVYKSPGVNRPLRCNEEDPMSNVNHTLYRDQINKVANAVKELIRKMHHANESVHTKPQDTKGTTESDSKRSIAVLPFLNLSKDPSQEYFADGITENILTQLAGIENLKVISRTSVMRYKNSLKSVCEIADELNVHYVLEGSAQSYGEKIRINAQLIEAKDDRHVWAKAFDRELKDLFEIQSYVANEVVEQLKVVITPSEKTKFGFVPTKNLEAYDLYLKGRHSLNLYTLEGGKLAEHYFKLALQEDASFTLAYSGLARTYLHSVTWMGDRTPSEGLPLIEAHLNLIMKGELSEMDYLTLGLTHMMVKVDYQTSEKWFSKGIATQPNSAELLYGYSYLLNMTGRSSEALACVNKAIPIDPVSVPAFNYIGVTYYIIGKLEDAVTTFNEAIRIHPLAVREYDHLAKAYIMLNKYQETVQTINSGLLFTSSRPPSMLVYLSIGYHKLEEVGKSKKLLEELMERSLRGEKGINIYLAQYYSLLNKKEEAFHWLEKAVETKDVDLFWLKSDPLFTNLHCDDRYNQYLKKAGFEVKNLQPAF